MYMNVLPAYMCVRHVHTCRIPLELGLQVLVSCHVGPGN